MIKKVKKFKFLQLNKIEKSDNKQLINLILRENPEAILASLSPKNISSYLHNLINSENLFLFVLKKKNTIIAYAVVAKQINFLTSIFSNMKLKIFLDLVMRLKLIKIMNMILSYFKLDMIFLNKEKKKIINKNYNLNLLAVKKKFQSKGIGSYFLKKIFKKIKKSKFITVESIDDKAYNFYKKKHNFIYLGEKYRIKKNLKILSKKLI